MPAPNILRSKQRAEIRPLIEELNDRFAREKHVAIAERSGLTHYQVGRILGDYLPAPTYLDITKLIRAADMSPNEAAHIVGLYDTTSEEDEETLVARSSYERRILSLLRRPTLRPSQRLILAQVIEAFVNGLEGQIALDDFVALDKEIEPEEEPQPRRRATRARSTG